MHARVFDGQRVHVRRRRCSTCIFGPNRPVSEERVAQMVASCGDEGTIPCHHHLYVGAVVEPVCRGFYDTGNNVMLRLATFMEIIEWHDEDPWD
jgi:hypothetical protein